MKDHDHQSPASSNQGSSGDIKYRNLFNNINTGVALHEIIQNDRGDVIDYIFLDINPAYEQMTGLKKKDVIGKRVKEIIPYLEPKWLNIYGDVALNGTKITFREHSAFLNKHWDITAFSYEKNRFIVSIFDITEYQLALEKYHYVMDASRDGIWDWDLKTNHVEHSPGWLKILGLQHAEPEFRTWEERLHPDDREKALQSIDAHLKGLSDYWESDHRLRHANGQWIWVKSRGKIVEQNSKGKPLRVVGTITDINEKMKSEKELRDQKNLLDAIIDQSPVPTWIGDKRGVLIRCNQALLHTLNFKESDILNIYNILNDKNIEAQGNRQLVLDVFDHQRSVHFVQCWEKEESGIPNIKGKDRIYIDVTLFPICDTNDILQNVVCQWIDITDHFLTEMKIKESEERYRTYIDNAPFAVFIVDGTGKYLEANNAAIAMTGYSVDEIKNMKISDFSIDRKTNEEALRHFMELQNSGHMSISLPFRRKDRSEGWWTIDAVKLSEDRYIGFSSDISDKIAMHHTLESGEKRFRELVDTINSGVAVYQVINQGKNAKDYIIRDFNQTALKMEGMKKEDIVGKTLQDIRPNIDAFGLIPVFQKVWKTGEPAFYPAKNYTDEKFANYFENRVFRLPNHEIVAIFDDVTQRELANKRIQDSEERFDLAMSASKDGLYDWDLITNDIYFSPGWKNMLGFKYDELPNDLTSWEIYTHPDDLKQAWNMIDRVKNKELPRFDMEFRMRHKDGHWVDVLSRGEIIFDKNNKAIRMIGTHVDISEQKRTENDLLSALKKAQESDRLKSAFLANISHEIRTPMNGILGFSDLLKHQDLGVDKQMEYINIIQHSGKRMLNTINDLIDISRIEAGQVKITNTKINFNEQLDQLYRFFKHEAEEKALEFVYEPILDNSKANLLTDEEKFYAIMSNYLKNAIKYTDEGMIRFGYRIKENEIEFYVQDTGIGIPADKHDAVFERFVQADLSITKPYEGSGLGLAISKAYAEMINGKVRVESAPGIGSCFFLTLPFAISEKIKSGKTEHIERVKENKTGLKDMDILIVEDDEASVLYLEALLEDKCHAIYHAGTGSGAIEMIKRFPETDLIFMDVRMPDMDGYTATERIREFNQSVLILAQTAYAMESDRERALKAGCNAYISKPIREEELFPLIDKLITKTKHSRRS